jgi:hypothetical protein
LNKRKSSKSPKKYDAHRQSPAKILEEQMARVSLIDRENFQLREEVALTKQEYDKINFKYAKA